MFARVATFEGGDVEQMRNQNNEMLLKDPGQMPAGIRKVMVLEGDQRLVISFFETREALDASEQQWEELGDQFNESVRGKRLGVAAYEVLFEMETINA